MTEPDDQKLPNGGAVCGACRFLSTTEQPETKLPIHSCRRFPPTPAGGVIVNSPPATPTVWTDARFPVLDTGALATCWCGEFKPKMLQ